MKVDKRKLGKQIKMVRTSKRMTQEELAEMIDVSPTFISLVETGTKALSLSKAIELADVLKVSMDVLFHDHLLLIAVTPLQQQCRLRNIRLFLL